MCSVMMALCSIMETVSCPIHGEHEIYEGWRKCPIIAQKADYLADKHDVEPIEVISTLRIRESVEGELLGGVDWRGGYV